MPGDCPKQNEYCKVTNCATTGGTCTPKPASNGVATPICGCDKVTYWNESVAARDFGMNVKAALGECPKNDATTCTSQAPNCDGKRVCNLGTASLLCAQLSVSGTCWGLPTTCPTLGGKYSECKGVGNNQPDCVNACEAIRDEVPFYEDARCPP